MKIFYHIDFDGKCAGFIVRKFYETLAASDNNKLDIKMIPINYGWDLPWDEFTPGEIVYIVDFSIEPDDMTRLLNITKNVVWIDHHKTAIEKYNSYQYINGLRYDGISGCELTYIYLYSMDMGAKRFNPDMVNNIPEYIRLIGDHDIWAFKYGDKTKDFIAGLKIEETNPDKENGALWERLYSEDYFGYYDRLMQSIIEHGKIIRKYTNMHNAEMLKSKGFPIIFENHSMYALNIHPGFANLSVFDSLDDYDKYDAFIIFGYNGVSYNYTIYSNKMDVSEIAKKYNGGGHAGAAGFKSNTLLF